MDIAISLAPEVLFEILGFPVTNSFLWGLVISLSLMALAYFSKNKRKEIPSRFQGFMELMVGSAYDFVDSMMSNKGKTKKVFPLVFTMFVFILVSNLVTLIPGQAAVTLNKADGTVAVFRAVMADYGMVLVMTLITVLLVQIVAIAVNGPFGYITKFINFKSPLAFFLGIMDFVGELAKVLSLSFRLFGNIFAGEVLTAVILGLLPFFGPLPFMALSLLSAVVQAFVFSVLTAVFIDMASEIEPEEV